MVSHVGTVYLVGAGPGDPGLLTHAGADALSRADVVVYDRLAAPELLDLASPQAERIYVGKASAQHTRTQTEINMLLVDLAMTGKTICRLKGGDPFVFGRGGEEAAYLQEHGISYVIVPGVTSAIAVPAYAGIPVTDRGCASSFAVITGHEDPGKPSSSLNWAGIARGADTLVFLMGLANISTIAAQLIAHGRSPATPAAAIQQGTTNAQRVVVGTLATLPDLVAQAALRSPVITVVGEVVRLRETLAWFEQRPLFGKRILVTRTREQAGELARALAAEGAIPVESPVIRIEPLPPAAKLLERVQAADWLVFTSANGLPHLLRQVESLGADIRALGHARIAAIGPATARTCRERGLRVNFMPERYIAESVAEEFPDPTGQRIVIARAEEAREVLPDLLMARGAQVDVILVYRTIAEDAELPDLGEMDAITFTSSSTVRAFRQRYPGAIAGPRIACIGPVTADTAREVGLPVDIVADPYTIPALVEALAELFTDEEKS
jgi:uroporphyrinogen III methyltransferase/synthase